MQDILHHALEATVGLWSSLILIFTWIGQAAAILDNPGAQTGAIIQGQYRAFLERLSAQLTAPSGEAIRGLGEHFLKITRSYWPGLFHCYNVAGLLRTDNDLEHLFGTLRHQERRITGRKVATPSLITRGPVRVLAAVISRLQPVDPVQLGLVDPMVWQATRRQLQRLRQARGLQRRFRRHPEEFLAGLEERLAKLSLPL